VGNGYTVPPLDQIDRLMMELSELKRRVSETEMFTGAEIADALATLQDLVDGLLTQVNGIFSGYITAGGDITAGGRITSNTGISSLPVYSNNLNTGPLYRAVYALSSDGQFGYVPSSIRFKMDVVDYEIDIAALRRLRVVTYRYIAAVENMGDDARTEVGLIAEEVHDLGMWWLVDYDEDGSPFGLKYERLAIVTLLWCQFLDARLDAAGLL